MKLLGQALGKMLSGLLVMGLLLLGPAGTWHYPGAWRLLALLFLPMPVVGLVLYRRAPELLRKRLNSREQEPEQRKVILLSALIFITGFVLAGLDFRFGWTRLPGAVIVVGCLLFVMAYGLYAEVLRENAYLSRTVEIQEGQRVIDTGLYGVVPLHAPGAGLRRGAGAVSAGNSRAGEAHPERGAGTGGRTARLSGLYLSSEIPPSPGDLVRRQIRFGGKNYGEKTVQIQ